MAAGTVDGPIIISTAPTYILGITHDFECIKIFPVRLQGDCRRTQQKRSFSLPKHCGARNGKIAQL